MELLDNIIKLAESDHKIIDLLDRLADVVKDQQKKIEKLTDRVKKLENALDLKERKN